MYSFKRSVVDENWSESKKDRHVKYEAYECLLYVEQMLEEIRKIFQVQLEKSGNDVRTIAVEEIISYLLTNKIERHRGRNDDMFIVSDSYYAESLITIAQIIEAINNNKQDELSNILNNLPWGTSNTGDQLAWNTTMFSYWILSDESRNLFGDIFKKYFREKSFAKEEDQIQQNVSDIENYTTLPILMKHNQAERERYCQDDNLPN
ncbi:MAG: hypothetical protein E7356_03640 [Clostridiales bacterium]|nr:hypothetical protein [Clostridiales bacterium]